VLNNSGGQANARLPQLIEKRTCRAGASSAVAVQILKILLESHPIENAAVSARRNQVQKDCMFDWLSEVVFTLNRVALVRARAASSNRPTLPNFRTIPRVSRPHDV
jgi:hypothetical protein